MIPSSCSDQRTTTETRMTASCLIMLKNFRYMIISTSAWPFRIVSPRSSSQRTALVQLPTCFWLCQFCSVFKFCQFSQQCVLCLIVTVFFFGGSNSNSTNFLWKLLCTVSTEVATAVLTSDVSCVQLSRWYLVTIIFNSTKW